MATLLHDCCVSLGDLPSHCALILPSAWLASEDSGCFFADQIPLGLGSIALQPPPAIGVGPSQHVRVLPLQPSLNPVSAEMQRQTQTGKSKEGS